MCDSTQDILMCVTSLAGPEYLGRVMTGHPSISSQARNAFQSVKQDQSGLLWMWLRILYFPDYTLGHPPHSKARGGLGICQLTHCSFLSPLFLFLF